MGYKISIDGPSGAGKGCVAKSLSEKLGILNIDTGAMYRAFALYCNQTNVDVENEAKVKEIIGNVDINLEPGDNGLKVFLNGEDVSGNIRNEQIGMLAAKVSVIPEVREYMKQKQRALAGSHNVVTEGRDIGSVVFQDAELKIYLTADVDTRAHRRHKDLLLKNKDITFEQVLRDIKRRDESDKTRKISPLIKTEDMIEIDNTSLSKEQVVEKVLQLVASKGLVKGID
ncbi:MAG: (d)CMP kinase [Clostridia bacterium]|nr:(d)CMP kinase [Clostridia bacterium]